METQAQRDALLRHILSAEREEAKNRLLSIVHSEDYETALRKILEPPLRIIGDRWSKDSISLAQGFVAGKVAEDFIANTKDHFLKSSDSEPPIEKGSPPRVAVMGNIEDDYHSLGRSMVISSFRPLP